MPSHPDRVRRNYKDSNETSYWCGYCDIYFKSQEELDKHLSGYKALTLSEELEAAIKDMTLAKYSE